MGHAPDLQNNKKKCNFEFVFMLGLVAQPSQYCQKLLFYFRGIEAGLGIL